MRKSLSLAVVLYLAPSPFIGAQPSTAPNTHVVTVNPDGSFTPPRVEILDGDSVEWHLPAPGGSIIPVDPAEPGADPCPAYRPYDPDDPNEFTGPMPRAVSGIFAISPQEMPYASQESTWASPNLTGIFIRLRWDDVHTGENEFNWTQMDREIEQAVNHGKLYSLGFKAGSRGTPRWIFNPERTDHPVTPLDFGFKQEGRPAYQGSPTDPNFQHHYFGLLRAVAAHLRERNAWFRALAYIKISGANLHTHENRLPNETVQDLATWAGPGHYTPSGLYEFYAQQTEVMTEVFPGKDMSYALIQAGFPRINDQGEYAGQPDPIQNPLPTGAGQTEHILHLGRETYGMTFVVQHNGLQPKPDFCPGSGQHPIEIDPGFHYVSSGCPNRWVLQHSEAGLVTGYQTLAGLQSLANLESALQNEWDNSDGIFLEIYESFVAPADAGPLPSGLWLGEWAERFHQRRRDMWPTVPDPLAATHRHTFTRTDAGGGEQLFHYISGSRCGARASAPVGVVAIVPSLRFVSVARAAKNQIALALDVRRPGILRVEFSDTPTGTWTLLGTRDVPAGPANLTDPAPSPHARFYRASLLPSP